MKILIAGDSFAADWSVKYSGARGWPNLLSEIHDVTNVAQAGASEYRIFKQLQKHLSRSYDLVLVSHTSPYRIYTEYNPVRKSDLLHQNCDLLYSDVKELSKSNSEYQGVVDYFEKFMSLEYADFCHELILEKISQLLVGYKSIEMVHMYYKPPPFLDLTHIKVKYPGVINHYSDQGNQLVSDIILNNISS